MKGALVVFWRRARWLAVQRFGDYRAERADGLTASTGQRQRAS